MQGSDHWNGRRQIRKLTSPIVQPFRRSLLVPECRHLNAARIVHLAPAVREVVRVQRDRIEDLMEVSHILLNEDTGLMPSFKTRSKLESQDQIQRSGTSRRARQKRHVPASPNFFFRGRSGVNPSTRVVIRHVKISKLRNAVVVMRLVNVSQHVKVVVRHIKVSQVSQFQEVVMRHVTVSQVVVRHVSQVSQVSQVSRVVMRHVEVSQVSQHLRGELCLTRSTNKQRTFTSYAAGVFLWETSSESFSDVNSFERAETNAGFVENVTVLAPGVYYVFATIVVHGRRPRNGELEQRYATQRPARKAPDKRTPSIRRWARCCTAGMLDVSFCTQDDRYACSRWQLCASMTLNEIQTFAFQYVCSIRSKTQT
ncbi:hypothetical protein DPMN_139322 [Dreissena polymorpha]|uniref:TNF family profile domain-containing protein n=1 Tax=Dreissena polymorpha TaxID=45954 RepID=A0A9D4G5L8_DREPO|nr:hypothetical protein DPMN_139322 [Dreissena polymorpha]